jgi:hypothetical protein
MCTVIFLFKFTQNFIACEQSTIFRRPIHLLPTSLRLKNVFDRRSLSRRDLRDHQEGAIRLGGNRGTSSGYAEVRLGLGSFRRSLRWITKLFLIRGFAHDPQRILAAVDQFALVSVKLLLDGGLGIPHVRVSRELGVTVFADSEHRNVPNSFDDPKIALRHETSFPRAR